MNNMYSDECYKAWRRSEGYAVPCNEEGYSLAEARYNQFAKGFYAGVQASANVLERQHSKEKQVHKFYLLAKQCVEHLLFKDTVDCRGLIRRNTDGTL